MKLLTPTRIIVHRKRTISPPLMTTVGQPPHGISSTLSPSWSVFLNKADQYGKTRNLGAILGFIVTWAAFVMSQKSYHDVVIPSKILPPTSKHNSTFFPPASQNITKLNGVKFVTVVGRNSSGELVSREPGRNMGKYATVPMRSSSAGRPFLAERRQARRKFIGSSHTATGRNSSDITERRRPKQKKRDKVIALSAGKHLLWRGRQERQCRLLAKYAKAPNYKTFLKQGFSSEANNSTKFLVSLKTRCKNLSAAIDGSGTGNVLMALYAARLAAGTAGADFEFICKDDSLKLRRESIAPWLQVQAPLTALDTKLKPSAPLLKEACRGMGYNPVHYMVEAIRDDLRQMAFALLGRQSPINTTVRVKRPFSPKPKDTVMLDGGDVDDVAIHFRCGYLLLLPNIGDYGFVRFSSYRRRILQNVTSIGIITTSFDPTRNRKQDAPSTELCEGLVQVLMGYLQKHFPSASVSLRNSQSETIVTSYARLILAKQSFAGPSTFGVFPLIASLGEAYLQKSKVTYIASPIAEAYDNVHLMDEPILGRSKVGEVGMVGLLRWLTED